MKPVLCKKNALFGINDPIWSTLFIRYCDANVRKKHV